ncbi:MAG: cysteine hydrolase family protein [Bryobacteraceae bacterium]
MKTVFVDVDTQIDFLFPAGALYVPGAEKLVPTLARLNRYAAEHGIPLISTTDAHDENDPEFYQWPPHCIAGTLGQHKPPETLLDRQTIIPNAPAGLPAALEPQIIVLKHSLNCFENPNLPALLERLNADRYVVYGVVTEYCVRRAALGLLKTGKPVEVVVDAIRSIDEKDAARTMNEIQSGGGALISVEQVCV